MSHHGQANQNEAGPEAAETRLAAAAVAGRFIELLTGVFVVRCDWFNELSFDRTLWPLYHLYAITLRIVLNFVHDVVDKEDAPS
jgi:hypothetical protein